MTNPTCTGHVTAHSAVLNSAHTKLCPSCGTRCFSDATRCYECLYEFDSPAVSGNEKTDTLQALEELVSKKNKDAELVAVGVVVVEKESAPEGALEITMKFNESYASRLANSFSACS